MAEIEKKKFDQNDTDLEGMAERLGHKTPPQASPADPAARVVARRGAVPEAGPDASSHPSIARADEAQPAAQPAAQYIAQHTVASGETLSHIALKYYGSAVREAWMHIYEANKALIGPNPGIIRPGMVLNIPPKPAL